MKLNRAIGLIVCLVYPYLIFAQSNVDFIRSTGKIYSVVAVVCLLFLFLAVYLYRLDRKISDLEKKIKNES